MQDNNIPRALSFEQSQMSYNWSISWLEKPQNCTCASDKLRNYRNTFLPPSNCAVTGLKWHPSSLYGAFSLAPLPRPPKNHLFVLADESQGPGLIHEQRVRDRACEFQIIRQIRGVFSSVFPLGDTQKQIASLSCELLLSVFCCSLPVGIAPPGWNRTSQLESRLPV